MLYKSVRAVLPLADIRLRSEDSVMQKQKKRINEMYTILQWIQKVAIYKSGQKKEPQFILLPSISFTIYFLGLLLKAEHK